MTLTEIKFIKIQYKLSFLILFKVILTEIYEVLKFQNDYYSILQNFNLSKMGH